MAYEKIFESEYGGSPHNFHVSKHDDELHVELTYPPYTDAENTNDQCRYVVFDQESVRASDGIRIHFDFNRNGYVIEQAKQHLVAIGPSSYEDRIEWIEVGFFEAWPFGSGDNTAEEYAAADAAYEAAQGGVTRMGGDGVAGSGPKD